MAVKWAVANGNWSAGTTWNDGVVPVGGDEIYCNGHEITLNVNITTQVTVKNTLNQSTNISGGGLVYVNGLVYNINVEAGDAIFLHKGGTRIFTINGDITANNTINGVFYKSISYTGQFNVIINGNITLNNSVLFETYGNTTTTGIIINGNVMTNVELVRKSTGGNTIANFLLTVNGTCEWLACQTDTFTYTSSQHFTFNGIWRIKKSLATPNIMYWVTVNGNIEYEFNAMTLFPLTSDLFEIGNPDTFLMKDISEPRVNPFIIVTNADMNNRQQYPPENEVKEGTEYVWGEKVGTYTPDYPPESVVLKDYEYGDSDDRKTGTMPVLSQQLISRLENCATVETVQQLLVAHLDN